MNKIIAFSFLTLILASFQLSAQHNYFRKQLPQLNKLKKEGRHTEYFSLINQIGDTIYKYKDFSYIDEMTILLSEGPTHMNEADRFQYRNTLMLQASLYYYDLKNDFKAEKLYLKAHNIAKDIDTLKNSVWFVENILGSIYLKMGDYDKSLYYYQFAEKHLLKANNQKLLSRLYSNIGKFYRWKNDFNTSQSYYEKGIDLAKKLDYEEGLFSNILQLIDLKLLRKDCTSSEKLIRQLGAIEPNLKDSKNFKKFHRELLLAKANTLVCKKMYNLGIKIFEDVIHELQLSEINSQFREIAKLYIKISEAYFENGNHIKSELAFQNGMKTLLGNNYDPKKQINEQQLYQENSFVELFTLKSKLDSIKFYTFHHDTDGLSCLEQIKLAFHVNDLMINSFIGLESKLMTVSDNAELVSRGMDIAYKLHERNPSSQTESYLNFLFDKSKSALLSNKAKINDKINALNPAQKVKIESLQLEIMSLYEKPPSTEQNQLLVVKIKEANDLLSNVVKIKEEERKKIDGIFIEYFQGSKDTYARVRENANTQFYNLGSSEFIVNHIKDFIKEINSLSQSKNAAILYKLLIEPLNLSSSKNVTIVADGALHACPFEALQIHEGKNFMNDRNLLYKYQVENTTQNKHNHKVDLVAIAPNYSKTIKTSKTRSGFFHLPFAMEEVKAISNLFNKEEVFHSLTKTKFIEAMKIARILHFTGHGFDEVDDNYLLLDANNKTAERLSSKEMFNQTIDNELVVLSACETGIGKNISGDGMRSMGRAMLEAGAQSVLISLWKVNDQSTSVFMKKFYQGLKTGMKKSEALYEAKNSLQKMEAYSHPYYWAGFILIGDDSPIHFSKFNFWYLFLIPIMIFLLYYLITKNKNKMRTRNFILGAMILWGVVCEGQIDTQWYIYDYRNTISNTNFTCRNNRIEFSGLNTGLPYVSNNNVLLTPGDDIFVVYKNNGYKIEYYNSRYDNNTFSNGVYQFPDGFNPSHLYWTNLYDGDDPRGGRYGVNISCNISSNSDINIGFTHNPGISSNHNPVRGKDYTIILDSINGQYELIFDSTKLQYLGSLNGAATLVTPNKLQFGAGTSLESDPSDNKFFNFRVLTNAPIGDSIKTIVNSITSPTSQLILNEPILRSHDPNYLAIKCLEFDKETGFTKIIYGINVHNTGEAEAIRTSVRFNQYKILDEQKLNICNHDVDVSSKLVNIDLDRHLDPNEEYYLELCLSGYLKEYDAAGYLVYPEALKSGNLFFHNPVVTMDSREYEISELRDYTRKDIGTERNFKLCNCCNVLVEGKNNKYSWFGIILLFGVTYFLIKRRWIGPRPSYRK
jgi:CHAT domain-containing protein